MDEFRKLEDINAYVPKLRALLSNEVLMLAPKVSGNIIYSPLVVWSESASQAKIKDVDSNQYFLVKTDIESDFEGYTTDAALEILDWG